MSTLLENWCIDVTLTASTLRGSWFDVMEMENVVVSVGNYGLLNDQHGDQQSPFPGNLSNIITNIHTNNSTNTHTPHRHEKNRIMTIGDYFLSLHEIG